MREAGPDSARRIRWGFRLATARQPAAREVEVLRGIAEKELARYRADRAAALRLVSVGESHSDPKVDACELAAWTVVASTILNLDETITKE